MSWFGRPAPLAPGVRSVHVGVPILLPQRQIQLSMPQPAIPSGAPTFWSPYQFSIPVERPPVNGKASIGDARWTPTGMWDIVGLSNMENRWPDNSQNPHQGVVTKVAFGGGNPAWYSRVNVQRPTPSLPLPQPIVQPGYGLMGGMRS